MRHAGATTLLLLSSTCIALGSVAAQDLGTSLSSTGSAHTWLSTKKDVKIAKGMGAVSAKSSLRLEWYVVVDSTMGIVFNEPVGARGTRDGGYYRYESDMKMLAMSNVTAFEVRILTFDVWKAFTGTLSFTQLEDMRPGQMKGFKRQWGAYGQSWLRAHFTSIAYVARVRMADGETLVADPQAVLDLAKTIQRDLTLKDIEPEPEPVAPLTTKS